MDREYILGINVPNFVSILIMAAAATVLLKAAKAFYSKSQSGN